MFAEAAVYLGSVSVTMLEWSSFCSVSVAFRASRRHVALLGCARLRPSPGQELSERREPSPSRRGISARQTSAYDSGNPAAGANH